MNFGQNIFNWMVGNVQPLVLCALLVIAVYFFIERKFSKIAGLLIIAVIVVGIVFNTAGVKDMLLSLFNSIFQTGGAVQ